jgi:hypothetical protein
MDTSFATITREQDRSLPQMRLYEKTRGVSLDEVNRATGDAEEV